MSSIGNVTGNTYYYQNSSAAYSSSGSDLAFKSIGYKTNNTAKTEKNNNISTKVTLSEEALKKLNLAKATEKETSTKSDPEENVLTENEKAEVADLKARDVEVRAHELAHVMAGGSLVRRGATYQYTTGPDGKRYAVGGEVSIDISPVEDDPSATITKMEQVKRAALAPAEPSSQDRSVAATASQNEAQARQELLQEGNEE